MFTTTINADFTRIGQSCLRRRRGFVRCLNTGRSISALWMRLRRPGDHEQGDERPVSVHQPGLRHRCDLRYIRVSGSFRWDTLKLESFDSDEQHHKYINVRRSNGHHFISLIFQP